MELIITATGQRLPIIFQVTILPLTAPTATPPEYKSKDGDLRNCSAL